MATRYLLPCQCGKKSEVDANQAGLTVRCACGAELAVPAMRGLATLEKVESAPAAAPTSAAPAWGARQGVMFLGAAILIVAGLAALFFWIRFVEPVTLRPDYQEVNRERNEELSLEDSFAEWREKLQKGIEIPELEMQLEKYEEYNEGIMQWEFVCGGFAAIGLLLMVVGLFLPEPRGGRS
ncbi:MAG TPA: hypothetical protein VFI31_09190 [Pirellulales bacterium]|nr:hypothetical protein [Pirellulales bacterium]